MKHMKKKNIIPTTGSFSERRKSAITSAMGTIRKAGFSPSCFSKLYASFVPYAVISDIINATSPIIQMGT